MGNIFGSKSTSCSNGDSSTTNLIPNEYDRAVFAERSDKVHRGTIAVAIVYAFIALIILLGSYLFDSFKFVMFTRFFVFTFVFILGTILLIAYLMYSVLNYKPIKLNRMNNYDNLSCPDYWTLEQVPITAGDENEYYQAFDSNNFNTNLFNYKCVLNDKIFNKLAIQKAANNLGYYDYLYMTGSSPSLNNLPTSYTLTDHQNKQSRDNILFANLNDGNNTNTSNFYKKMAGNVSDTSNIIRYEMAKNSLIMNNYEIIPNKPPNDTYTIFKPILANSEILTDVNNDTYKLNKIEFNADAYEGKSATDSSTDIGSKYIRLNKNGLIESSLDGISSWTPIKTLPLRCDNFYPLLLSSKDNELATNNLKLDNNVLRCAYSKMCKVPWSDMNCDKYNDL